METYQEALLSVVQLKRELATTISALFAREKANLAVEQLPVLMAIYHNPGRYQQEIATLTYRDKSSVQRTVINLERKGYVHIIGDRTDRRRKLLVLTRKGCELSEKIALLTLT